MTLQNIKCPNCQTSELIHKGKLFDSDYFSGIKQNNRLDGGELIECAECRLAFRNPIIQPEDILTLYRNGLDSLYLTESSKRKDWIIASKWIEQFVPENGSLLDVGCFDGAFLKTLLGKYNKYGIEIHPAAVQSAQINNITILCSDLNELQGINRKFDCITLIDVIEHVKNPGAVLNDCLAKLNRNGVLIVTTGNYDSWQFKLMAPNYWYCNIEHIAFIGERWLKNFFLVKGEIKNTKIIKFSHRDRSLADTTLDLLKNILYICSPSLFRSIKKLLQDRHNKIDEPSSPPDWKTAKDHIAIFMQI